MSTAQPSRPPYRSPLLYAIVLHALIFVFLFWHFASSSSQQQAALQPDVDIIKAVAVSPEQLKTQLAQLQAEKQQAAEQLRRQQEQQQRAKAEALHKKQMEQQKKAEAQAQAKQQEIAREKAAQAKKAAEQALKLQQQQEATLKAAALKAKQQADAAAAKAKQQQALEKEIAHEKAQQQTKDSEDLAAAALAEQSQEKTKQAEQEKKAAQKLKIAQQKALDAQIAQEKHAEEAARTKDLQSEIEKYKALIENAIQQFWIVPGDANPNLSCDLLIRVGAGGEVISVEVVRSSGDGGLDNSARTAVFKASPLPVPEDKDLFEQFRELKLTVKPEVVH